MHRRHLTLSCFLFKGFLDPEKKLFSHRILSRDECIDPFSKTGNLRYVPGCAHLRSPFSFRRKVCVLSVSPIVLYLSSHLPASTCWHVASLLSSNQTPPFPALLECPGSGGSWGTRARAWGDMGVGGGVRPGPGGCVERWSGRPSPQRLPRGRGGCLA